MKSLFCWVLFLIVPAFALCQTSTDKIIFLDTIQKINNEESHYLRKVKDYYSKIPSYEYVVEDYYKSGKIQMVGKTLNKEYLLRNGDFIYYYENGNKEKMLKYDSSIPVGKIYQWHENGNKRLAGEYFPHADKLEKSELKIYQYWNKDNVQKVTDGNGFYEEIDSQFKTIASGEVKNSSKHGEWTGKDTKYQFDFKEIYENGKLISGESIDSLGTKHTYKKVIQNPEPIGGMADFNSYVAKKYRFPSDLIVHADVLIVLSFVINKDGGIQDVRVLQSVRKDLDDEAIRVLKSYEKWKPGYLRGLAVKVSYNLPMRLMRNE